MRLKQWGLTRKQFPVLVFFSVVGSEEIAKPFVVIDDIGKGETQVLVKLDSAGQHGGQQAWRLATSPCGDKRMGVCCFSQLVLKQILTDACNQLGVEPSDLPEVNVDINSMQRFASVETVEYPGLLLSQGSLLKIGRLSVHRKASAPNTRNDVAGLPFGLGLGHVTAKANLEHNSSDEEQKIDERGSNSCSSGSDAEDSGGHGDESADGDDADPPDRTDDRPPLPPPAEAPPPAELLELVIGLGLMSFDREPSVRAASCSVCGQRIPAGSYRWLAMPTPPRVRAYHFQKYLHARCPLDPRFPAVWLPGSIAFLSRLVAGDVPHELGLADVFAHILLRWEASRPAPGGHGSCRPGSSGD